jgi:hypothetical protein
VPITIPSIDDRRYQDLLNEALARIPVHTPEWTNFNKSDPGVTLIEIFAFLTETLLYRSNQIPERNRRKFLKLLGVPLQPGSFARGLVSINNAKGPLKAIALNGDLEVSTGQVPFRTARGLNVLPIEGRFYYKQAILPPSQDIKTYYQQLYASFRGTPSPIEPQLYQATPFPIRGGNPLQLADTVDGYIWLALAMRTADKPPSDLMDEARAEIAGQTLSIGVVPALANSQMTLPAGRKFNSQGSVTLQVDVPKIDSSGGLLDSLNRVPQYRTLDSSSTNDVFTEPGVIDVTLPGKNELLLWNNLDPLEAGVDLLPPSLDDATLNDRVITWLRIRPSASTQAQFLWMGINCVPVDQRAHVMGELLPQGTGEPDQLVKLSRAPVLAQSVQVAVTANSATAQWTEIDDLASAGPEVPVADPRLPPGVKPYINPITQVFALNAESGEIQFGDGMRGSRPPAGAIMRVDYDYSAGAAGNVGTGSINTAPALPPGLTVANPIPTWGGADAETVADGEKQISRYLQHRDRLVNAADFETITLRTPGVDIGRVDVVPNFNPELAGNQPGDAAGAVTLMIIPSYDAAQPDAPLPDRLFLDTICSYLDGRRLITTEVFLRGPNYRGIWISIGIKVLAGLNDAPIREAVKQAILAFLAPFPGGTQQLPNDPTALLSAPQAAGTAKGWPLGRPVIDLELATVAGRVPGVDFVQPPILIAEGAGPAITQVNMSGLDLPRILGISVTSGAPMDLDQLRGLQTLSAPALGPVVVQVPVIPEECR